MAIRQSKSELLFLIMIVEQSGITARSTYSPLVTNPHIVEAFSASNADCLSINKAWTIELFPPELGPYIRVILDKGALCSMSPNALKFLKQVLLALFVVHQSCSFGSIPWQ